jgi:hypothetical protein
MKRTFAHLLAFSICWLLSAAVARVSASYGQETGHEDIAIAELTPDEPTPVEPASSEIGAQRLTIPPIKLEPLSREQIDVFFDSLRASSPYTPPPIQLSQKVDATTSGIWSGTVFEPEGEIKDITLRFRPSIEERLKRAESGASVSQIAELVDLSIRLALKGIQFSHSMAKDPLMANGFLSPLKLDARGITRTAFIRGAQDSGMYLSVPPMLSMEAAENWGVLVCPRTAQIVKNKSTEQRQLEFSSSPYELSEVKMTISANASGRLPTLNSKERLKMRISTTEHVPPATVAEDEEISVSPSLQVAYHPSVAPDFFRFAPHASSQQGIRIMSETENQAGHIRRAYFATTLYIHKLMEPSPVSVVVNGARVARDEGACYVVQRRKTRWAEYDRVSATK